MPRVLAEKGLKKATKIALRHYQAPRLAFNLFWRGTSFAFSRGMRKLSIKKLVLLSLLSPFVFLAAQTKLAPPKNTEKQVQSELPAKYNDISEGPEHLVLQKANPGSETKIMGPKLDTKVSSNEYCPSEGQHNYSFDLLCGSHLFAIHTFMQTEAKTFVDSVKLAQANKLKSAKSSAKMEEEMAQYILISADLGENAFYLKKYWSNQEQEEDEDYDLEADKIMAQQIQDAASELSPMIVSDDLLLSQSYEAEMQKAKNLQNKLEESSKDMMADDLSISQDSSGIQTQAQIIVKKENLEKVLKQLQELDIIMSPIFTYDLAQIEKNRALLSQSSESVEIRCDNKNLEQSFDLFTQVIAKYNIDSESLMSYSDSNQKVVSNSFSQRLMGNAKARAQFKADLQKQKCRISAK